MSKRRREKVKNVLTSILIITCIGLLFIACPTPLDLKDLTILQDLNPPEISITTPTAGSAFESSLSISGTIIDLDTEGEPRRAGDGSFIQEASFIILNQDIAATPIEVAVDGSFSFTIDTGSFDKQITLNLTAMDLNGNEATASVSFAPDTNGPNLILTSPTDYSEYGTVLVLSGYVTNSMNSISISEVSPQVEYAVPGTNIVGFINIHPETGAFKTIIDASTLDGTKAVQITAWDLNGNETKLICTILKPSEGGDISGFRVTPGNRKVSIFWEEVPLAESYTVTETRVLETSRTVTDASTYVWEGLDNGKAYSFIVTAHFPAGLGEDAISGSITKMPLSSRTFTPMVIESEYRSLTIGWQANPEVDEFKIERSLSPAGPWSIKSFQAENEFTDKELSHDTCYYYRITPVEYDEICSEYISGYPGRFGTDLIGSLPIGHVILVAASSDHVFALENNSVLNIYDSSNPESLNIIGSLAGFVNTLEITVSNEHAYISDDSGVHIVNISTPEEPYIEGKIPQPGNEAADGIFISGEYAYICYTKEGFKIYNISVPNAPDLIGMTNNIYVRNVFVAGNYAYFAAGDQGLKIYDITDPASPVYRGGYRTGSARELVVKGNYAYVTDSVKGLYVINVEVPETPELIKMIPALDGFYGIAESGDYIYLGSSTAGLQIYDISNPADPIPAVSINTPDKAIGIAVAGNHIYVGDEDSGLQIFESFSPAAPVLRGFYPTKEGQSFRGVDVRGDLAYLCNSEGLYIINIEDPDSPILSGSVVIPGLARCIIVSGEYAYIGQEADDFGLRIVDISNPSDPVIIGEVDTPGNAYDLVVSGEYAYIADLRQGLTIIDISNPASPFLVTTIDTIELRDVEIRGSYIYSTDSKGGVKIFDVSDPYTPFIVDSIIGAPVDRAIGLAVKGNYAYIGNGGVLNIINNISDFSEPYSDVGSYNTEATLYRINISGNYAFAANGDGGLSIFDILNPLSPKLMKKISMNSRVYELANAGRWAYVSGNEKGLQIIDLMGETP